jgi:hypothetical protein
MGESRSVYRVFVRSLKERGHLGDPGVDGMMILKWIFRTRDVGVLIVWSWLRIGKGGGHF